MLSRFLFLFHRRRGQQKERTTGGADNRRRGQQKERTTEGEDNGRSGQHEWRTAGIVAGGLSEDSGRCMRRGQRGGHREERTATMVATKQGSITFKREFFNKKGRFLFKKVVFKRVVFDLS